MPSTLGTGTGCGPVEMTKSTDVPGGTAVPGAGVCEITSPSGMVGLVHEIDVAEVQAGAADRARLRPRAAGRSGSAPSTTAAPERHRQHDRAARCQVRAALRRLRHDDARRAPSPSFDLVARPDREAGRRDAAGRREPAAARPRTAPRPPTGRSRSVIATPEPTATLVPAPGAWLMTRPAGDGRVVQLRNHARLQAGGLQLGGRDRFASRRRGWAPRRPPASSAPRSVAPVTEL